MQALTITFPGGGSLVLHILQPGEHFPGFSGRKGGLVVERTASAIVRLTHSDGMVEDTEFEINDRALWNWVAQAVKASAGRPRVEGPGTP